MTILETREAWLVRATAEVADLYRAALPDTEVPPVRVSVGWPGGRGKKSTTVGQCWAPTVATDGVAQMFVSPVLHEPGEVLHILAHELAHAIDKVENGHRGPFIRLARAIGLQGPWTATTPGPDLKAELEVIAERLGEYPHAAITLPGGGIAKQPTRMLKAECPNTKYLTRLTKKWVEEYGPPICPCCHDTMEMS